MLGGEIWIEKSIYGQGTTFAFTIEGYFDYPSPLSFLIREERKSITNSDSHDILLMPDS